jgi:anti-sigma factor RsiW
MSDLSLQLSAYIDHELSDEDTRKIETLLATDPALAAELEQLIAANDLAIAEFDAVLDEPVPSFLIDMIEDTDLDDMSKKVPQAANSNHSWLPDWRSAAARIALLVAGGLAGYVINDIGDNNPDSQKSDRILVAQNGPSWLQLVADYHGVYAGQKRHLVEVGADEADHIVKWLGNTTGVGFSIPDLSETGFEFQGARLLVVKGTPVAQLMYKNADGAVVAICFQQGKNSSMMAASDLNRSVINEFGIISWNDRSTNFLVIGDENQDKLNDIANLAKLSI